MFVGLPSAAPSADKTLIVLQCFLIRHTDRTSLEHQNRTRRDGWAWPDHLTIKHSLHQPHQMCLPEVSLNFYTQPHWQTRTSPPPPDCILYVSSSGTNTISTCVDDHQFLITPKQTSSVTKALARVTEEDAGEGRWRQTILPWREHEKGGGGEEAVHCHLTFPSQVPLIWCSTNEEY